MLSIPSQILALIDEGRFSIRWMLRFDLDSGATGIWTDAYTLSFEGVTYAGIAGNLDVSPIPGSTSLDSDRVAVTVSGLSTAVTTIIANETWHQRPAVLYCAFLDDAGAVQHAVARFAGFLDDLSISDASGDVCTVSMSIESNNRELNRSTGDTRSDASQRRRLSSDGFFKHAANAAVDSNIYWGRKGPQFPARLNAK